MYTKDLKVYGRRASIIKKTDDPVQTMGNLNADALRFFVDEEWESFTLIGQFTSEAGTVYEVVLDQDRVAKVPNELLQAAGHYNVSLVGTLSGARVVSTPVKITVYNTDYSATAASPADITPTLAQQLTATVNAAAANANAVKQAYDNGELNGANGTSGVDGVSPIITVTDITDGHRVSFTDAQGTKTFDVPDGYDGVSPTFAVSDITNGHRLTITDVNGTHNVDLTNGAPGKDGKDGQSIRVALASYSANGRTGIRLTLTDATGSYTTYIYDGTRGPAGEAGKDGKDGSDASVTSENITAALGYTPADSLELDSAELTILNKADKTEIPVALTDAEVDAILDQAVGTPTGSLVDTLNAQNVAIAGKISSVKVAGTALTKDADGAVDVPTASTSRLGVCKIFEGGGLYAFADGRICANFANTTSNIPNRTSGFVIGPHNLDFAVKAALADGKGAAYTAAEQAAARARIGAVGGKFELIETIDITEDTSNVIISRNVSPEGVAYNFSAVAIYISASAASANGDIRYRVNTTGTPYYQQRSVSTTELNSCVTFDGRSGLWDVRGTYTQNSTFNASTSYASVNYNGLLDVGNITYVEMQVLNSCTLKAGTSIKIYGVRG